MRQYPNLNAITLSAAIRDVCNWKDVLYWEVVRGHSRHHMWNFSGVHVKSGMYPDPLSEASIALR